MQRMFRRTLTGDHIFHHQSRSEGKDFQRVHEHQVYITSSENLNVLVNLIVFVDEICGAFPLVSSKIF